MSAQEFFQRAHGLDAPLLERVLARALARGGDYADVYVELRRYTSVHLEENLLKETGESVALGAGVRVVSGEETGYEIGRAHV